GGLGDGRRAYQCALVLRVRSLLPPFLRCRISPPKVAVVSLSGKAESELKAVAESIAAGRSGEALARARELESRYPDDPEVLHFAALALEEAREFEAGLARIRAALARKPDRADYHITLARLLVRAVDHPAALDAALRAPKLEPGSAEIHATP